MSGRITLRRLNPCHSSSVLLRQCPDVIDSISLFRFAIFSLFINTLNWHSSVLINISSSSSLVNKFSLNIPQSSLYSNIWFIQIYTWKPWQDTTNEQEHEHGSHIELLTKYSKTIPQITLVLSPDSPNYMNKNHFQQIIWYMSLARARISCKIHEMDSFVHGIFRSFMKI